MSQSPPAGATGSRHADKRGLALRIEGVTKRFGATTAVNRLSVDVEAGQILALLGPSGCGKTTLLRCIAGLESVHEGTIHIYDNQVSSPDVTTSPDRRGVGFVFQSYALWPHMTVYENVEYGLRLAKASRADRQRRVAETLETVGLTNYESRVPGELSGGQQQRVAVARSIVVRPKLLLLDEPLSNLDAALRGRMRRELRGLLKSVGITSVFVTHDQSEAFAISDLVVLMNAGEAVQIDHPEQLYREPTSVFAATFVGNANLLEVTDVSGFGSDGIATAASSSLGKVSGKVPSLDLTGTDAIAMFRPEDVQILHSEEGGPDEHRWAAVITERTFEGSLVELRARVGDAVIRAVGPHHDIAVGDRVDLHVPVARLSFLEPQPALTTQASTLE